ncbi:hypothetical protein N7462_006484 [Penicillium macrosclerotiorum]|uniref:uncharacterized protein n=1 Tax=Penicillium macrosclerotiorum TaxID=303699 RepID=UPI0025477301|nr:uncharacterized protein N7462_006484 [Penicillium macrosclerotiorum]KAJ5683319.1 hypothetical protein N7462_006484 [Penicillium macrosclerotiorum]
MDRPVGPIVSEGPALPPPQTSLKGRSVQLEPLDPKHTNDLFDAIGQPEQAAVWTYINKGPFEDKASFSEFIISLSQSTDPVFYALIDQSRKKAVGFFSLMRIDLSSRVVEIGYVVFSPVLQRSTAATEAFYLLARAVFRDLGYRRFEWKCDSLNAPSRRAAARFGFTAEGIFRQHMIVKGRNRDTAWFSILDSEWPALQNSFEKWLDPANFDAEGKQRQSLTSFRGE